MIAASYRHVALTVFAMSLSLSLPAFAQTKGSVPPSSLAPVASPDGDHGGWGNEAFEHQEFREEMAQIRKEHEEIEAARDKLMDKCVNTSGDQAEACNKERQELRERQAKLHERTHALHEKMNAARKEHPEGGAQQGIEGDRTPPAPIPPAAPVAHQ